jgi:small subunit ribosomal protein S21
MMEAAQNETQSSQNNFGQQGQGGQGYRNDRNSDLRPMEVRVDGDNINRAINQLKRKMANEGIYKELKKRRFYEKPSEQRKRKEREAERRLRKAQRRSN